MKTLASIILFLLLNAIGFAQSFNPRMNFFGGSEYYYTNCKLAALPDGGIIEMRSFVLSNKFRLHKTDSTGNLLWVKEYLLYDTIGNFIPNEMTLLNDNSVIVSGSVSNANYVYQNCPFAIRIDSSGAVLWQKIYPNNTMLFSAPVAVQKAPDTLLLITRTTNISLLQTGLSIVKLDGNGNIAGSNFIQIEDQYTDVQCGIVAANGNLILAGSSTNEMHFVSINPSLQVVDSDKYTGTTGNLKITSIVEDMNGNFTVLGNDQSTYNYVYKFDGNGVQYGATGFTTAAFSNRYFGTDLTIDNTGRVFTIAGEGGYPSPFNPYSIVYCWDDSLNSLSTTQYFGNGPQGIAQSQNGLFISLQEYYGFSGQYPVTYIETDSLGILACNSVPAAYAAVSPPALTSSAETILYLSPINFTTSNQIAIIVTNVAFQPALDYCLFDQISEEAVATENPIFPNPANETIGFEHSTFNNCSYAIYDVHGAMILNGIVTDNRININALTPGLYLISVVRLDGSTATQNFIKQ